MDLLHLFSIIVALSAVLAYINIRFLKLPATIGVMVLSLLLSLVVLLGGSATSLDEFLKRLLVQVDFSGFLLNFMLGFLLFAGGLHTDVRKLRKVRGPIITFATLGVVFSTFLVGTAVYFLLPLLFEPVPYIHCLLFGALISPTDPIAVLSILEKAGISESIETKITGESLFNDGMGVVMFLTLLNMAHEGMGSVTAAGISFLLLQEIGGGVLFGLVLGFLGFQMLKRIDHYQTEVLITLALVMGGTALAPLLHVSGALAMVVTGLYTGTKVAGGAMSEQTSDYVHKFWEMIDEIMNAVLFVLIGLELLIIPFRFNFVFVGLASVLLVIIARYLSLVIPSYLFHFKREFPRNTFLIMTWGGLRGAISIALALSLANEMHRNLFVSITYVVVLFSILVQGLTLERVVKRLK